jgi:hypothetical protein
MSTGGCEARARSPKRVRVATPCRRVDASRAARLDSSGSQYRAAISRRLRFLTQSSAVLGPDWPDPTRRDDRRKKEFAVRVSHPTAALQRGGICRGRESRIHSVGWPQSVEQAGFASGVLAMRWSLATERGVLRRHDVWVVGLLENPVAIDVTSDGGAGSGRASPATGSFFGGRDVASFAPRFDLQ